MHRLETGHSENVNHDINTDEENKTGGRRNFALIGGVIVVIAIAVYLVAAVYPSQLFSKSEDGGPIEQHQPAINAHPVLPPSKLKTSSEAVFASTDQVWSKIFKQMGKAYTKPGLQLFEDTITAGGCGFVKPATAPFYCAADKVIYVDLDFFAAIKNKYRAAADLAEAYAIAHQQGHYIQDLLGTTEKVEAKQGSMDNADYRKLLDKLELQADFYAGVWAHYAYKHRIEQADAEITMSSTTQIANLLEQKNDRVIPDPYSHSNVAERTRWFTKGYQSGDMKLGDKVFAKGDLE
jgi:predicted metalloprotease